MQNSQDTGRLQKRKGIRWIAGTIISVLLLICFISFLNWLIEDDGAWKPSYPKVDLSGVAKKEVISGEDYHTIFLQTGLGRAAADELLKDKDAEQRERELEDYQDSFFSSGSYECRKISVVVYEERSRDEEGNPMKSFEVADLKNGDILITKATHSLGWRHGHAAIVTNAAKGETLEAITLGSPSVLQNIGKWQTYPSFIQLRLKNAGSTESEQIAKYAKNDIIGLPYGLLTGIPEKEPEDIKKTQCSHLVWYPYKRFGYDLDSDGSWLVTPKDIAHSDLLEVVQVYGVNPEEIWP